MRPGRRAGYLAWALFAVASLAILAAWLISSRTADGIPDITPLTLSWSFPAVGAVIASRHPKNPIGWLFIAVGLLTGTQGLANAYAAETIRSGSTALFPRLAFWYATWAWLPPMILIAPFTLLLFPTGTYLSRLWRWVGRAAALGLALTLAGQALRPWEDAEEFGTVVERGISNPLALPLSTEALDVPLIVGGVLLLVGAVAGVFGMMARFRRSRGVERQQLKWVTLAVVVAVASYLAADLAPATVPDPFIAVTLPLIPAAAGFAILRHRLYDIDLLINRALVYGVLSVGLGGVYLLFVLAFGSALEPVTRDSDLAVAASTLVVAGLFRPARRRVQALIDKRFYRRRYDARRTLEDYARHLRDEVGLSVLRTQLVAAVNDTVRPAHVTLWLPESGRDDRISPSGASRNDSWTMAE